MEKLLQQMGENKPSKSKSTNAKATPSKNAGPQLLSAINEEELSATEYAYFKRPKPHTEVLSDM